MQNRLLESVAHAVKKADVQRNSILEGGCLQIISLHLSPLALVLLSGSDYEILNLKAPLQVEEFIL